MVAVVSDGFVVVVVKRCRSVKATLEPAARPVHCRELPGPLDSPDYR